MNLILHITSESAWADAQKSGAYTAPSLYTEGFIHCSTIEQATATAVRHFKGQKNLILLLLDEQKIKPEVKYEGVDPKNLYLHIYGPLNLDAVTGTVKFPPNKDGSFSLPPLKGD